MVKTRAAVFISAASRDLKSCREAVRDALLIAEILPRTQEHFPPDYRDLITVLRTKIVDSDWVICLVGFACGAMPTSTDGPPRSYTQIEYDLARELGKKIYVLLATEQFSPDQPQEPPEDLALQRRHREALLLNHKCEMFTSIEELRLRIMQIILREASVERLGMYFLHPPPASSLFLDRTEELAQLHAAVQPGSPSLIVVVGMGGQGKTALVHQWLRQEKPAPFSAGIWCTADRGGFSFDSFLDEAISYLLQGQFDKRDLPDGTARLAKLVGLLQMRPTLIVIDGIERWLKGWSRAMAESG